MIQKEDRWLKLGLISLSSLFLSLVPPGVRPNLKEEAFSDLLSDQGFPTTRDKTPKSLKDMKQKTDIDRAIDPERARVRLHNKW